MITSTSSAHPECAPLICQVRDGDEAGSQRQNVTAMQENSHEIFLF